MLTRVPAGPTARRGRTPLHNARACPAPPPRAPEQSLSADPCHSAAATLHWGQSPGQPARPPRLGRSGGQPCRSSATGRAPAYPRRTRNRAQQLGSPAGRTRCGHLTKTPGWQLPHPGFQSLPKKGPQRANGLCWRLQSSGLGRLLPTGALALGRAGLRGRQAPGGTTAMARRSTHSLQPTLSMWKMRSSSQTFSKHLSSVSTNTWGGRKGRSAQKPTARCFPHTAQGLRAKKPQPRPETPGAPGRHPERGQNPLHHPVCLRRPERSCSQGKHGQALLGGCPGPPALQQQRGAGGLPRRHRCQPSLHRRDRTETLRPAPGGSWSWHRAAAGVRAWPWLGWRGGEGTVCPTRAAWGSCPSHGPSLLPAGTTAAARTPRTCLEGPGTRSRAPTHGTRLFRATQPRRRCPDLLQRWDNGPSAKVPSRVRAESEHNFKITLVALGPSLQEGHRGAGACPETSKEAGEGSGAQVLRGAAGGAGAV